MVTITSRSAVLEQVVAEVVEPAASDVDRAGVFPRSGVDALGRAALLGLVSAAEVGGMGEGPRAAAEVVQRLAEVCASTAMVTAMHYCGAAVVEAFGPRPVREAIARGEHLTTLAFSEVGSRGHFWAPLSTARPDGERVHLDARKSFATSAGEVQSYVWSSRPAEAEGISTLWLVPATTAGLEVGARFDGLGLRGNGSTSVTASDAVIPAGARLGDDGAGFDIMMGTVLPLFQVLMAAVSVGIMEAIATKSAAHVAQVRYEHLGQTAADMPVTRHHVARIRIATDTTRALLLDTLSAMESGRDDTMLRVLEVKAAAADAATLAGDLGMRVCGGAAFRREVGVERHFRDARAATVMAPTTDVLLDFIGRAACGLPLFA
jgi:alkylation response protein AidB-like acyl-CoA dehydrogenase